MKISIVEDNEDVRRHLVRNINRAEGLCCISDFSNAEDALANIPVQRPTLVLMDIELPRMNGINCMARIRQQVPEIDFLMFTVFEHDESLFEALKVGAIGYILKKDGLTGVIQAIREYAEGGSPMSRDIARKVLASFSERPRRQRVQLESLTKRERQVLELLAEGLLNKEIADRLNMAESTAKKHNNKIFKKLHVFNRTEAVRKYLGAGK